MCAWFILETCGSLGIKQRTLNCTMNSNESIISKSILADFFTSCVYTCDSSMHNEFNHFGLTSKNDLCSTWKTHVDR